MTIQSIYNAVVEGQNKEVERDVQAALVESLPPDAILKKGLIAAMTEVGRRFEEGEFYVPEMLIAARAMQAGLQLLKPHLIASGVKAAGKMAIGTVKGDLHDIGKNLVAMMIEGVGFEVQDLGTNVTPEKFVEAVQQGAQVIGMSALLTTTMVNMQATITALEQAGLRGQVKVMVGGAPITEAFAAKIGADAFAPDASSAARAMRKLLSNG